MSIQWQPDARAERFAVLCGWRKDGRPEGELAKRLGFFGDPKLMYGKLAAEGSPVCPRCGGLYPDEEHDCEQPSVAKVQDQISDRKARGKGGGDSEELPAAAGASDLFSGAIERLKIDLYYAKHLDETLEDGRFAERFLFPKEAEYLPEIYHREKVSPERWEELCAEHGKDPASTKVLTVPVENRHLGELTWHPSMHLVRLIAVYLMFASDSWEVEELLHRLHPKSREWNIEQINKYLTSNEGLLPVIRRLATVVRGKTIKRGLNAEPVDPFEHTVGDFLRRVREQGGAEEEIMRELRDKFSEDEISRLEGIFSPRSSK